MSIRQIVRQALGSQAMGACPAVNMNMIPNPFQPQQMGCPCGKKMGSCDGRCLSTGPRSMNGLGACNPAPAYYPDPRLGQFFNFDWGTYGKKGPKKPPPADPCERVCNPRTGSDAACAACQARGSFLPATQFASASPTCATPCQPLGTGGCGCYTANGTAVSCPCPNRGWGTATTYAPVTTFSPYRF